MLSGTCKICQKNLTPVTISKKQFELLRTEFMANVVTGKNIYYNTTPEEWERFDSYIQETGPFDVIIDGLNVAYVANNILNVHHRKKPCPFTVFIK